MLCWGGAAPLLGANMSSGLSADTQALMTFESNKKSVGLAFVFWFFLGGLAATGFI